ncbi:MAG: site-specific integrase [Ilumatobacteraceae bacterium]
MTSLQVESLYATLLASGGAGGRQLAPKTVRNCHTVLRRALADAERLGLVSRNPAAAAPAVAAPRAEQRTWSSAEIQSFFETLAGERLSMAFVLLATTGMRRGEVLGLRWEDVDFTGRALSIVQTLTTVRGDKHIRRPKTGKSRRRVSIDAVTLDALKEHRKRQRVERIAAADVWLNEGDLVCTDELGEPCFGSFQGRRYSVSPWRRVGRRLQRRRSEAVVEEARRNLLGKDRPGARAAFEQNLGLIRDPLVPSAPAELSASLVRTDAKDRHVLAAAAAGGATILVTDNPSDFDVEEAGLLGVTVVTSDEFATSITQRNPAALVRSVQRTPAKRFARFAEILTRELPTAMSGLASLLSD